MNTPFQRQVHDRLRAMEIRLSEAQIVEICTKGNGGVDAAIQYYFENSERVLNIGNVARDPFQDLVKERLLAMTIGLTDAMLEEVCKTAGGSVDAAVLYYFENSDRILSMQDTVSPQLRDEPQPKSISAENQFKVSQLMDMISCSMEQAITTLEDTHWDVDFAIDRLLTGTNPPFHQEPLHHFAEEPTPDFDVNAHVRKVREQQFQPEALSHSTSRDGGGQREVNLDNSKEIQSHRTAILKKDIPMEDKLAMLMEPMTPRTQVSERMHRIPIS